MKVRKIFYRLLAFLLVCTISGFIIANALAKPIFLTNEEIRYYTNTAEKAWYEGLSAIKVYIL